MKIAIHHQKNSFSSHWISYCEEQGFPLKIVNCYDNDIINQLEDCKGLMWHFHQSNPKDVLFAKQLLYSLEKAGKKVFPDFHTCWHFDDKVGQKYLLEAIDAPLVPSYVFYDKPRAMQWIEETDFPKVFKLRRGAGSAHVKLVSNESEAKNLIKKAFGRGFSQYDKLGNLHERWQKYKKGKTSLWGVMKGVLRLGKTTKFARIAGRERGYVYFQDFIPGNNYDIRVIVIDGRAFAIKRIVRQDDFRASGSGNAQYEKHHFDLKTISLSLDIAEKLQSQCLSIDYVFQNETPLIVEISYGFPPSGFIEDCEGYWDCNLEWHEGSFNAYGWMVDSIVSDLE
ncbi:hypothetical protein CK503_14215 [Aliifodinibius salipaludis]|uniref:ATP-grasp domain-containing protein n=1 Tax=Fodinibius salipaludis TaxID=2032627 RepID=A0A2A2G7K3_9BACT|nr:hypothetical protein [Aliifodinibius salipaludis]PAU92839.1 hypothetical protein CK503_14215 [Aliifodinibius salipaludis]